MQPDNIIKVIFVGREGVGKTSCITRIVDDKFSYKTQMSTNPDHRKYQISINNNNYDLRLWDTAGQEKYRSISEQYYKGAKGAMIVVSVTDPDPQKFILDWLNSLKMKAKGDIVKIILFNKVDLEEDRIVTTQQIDQLQEEFKIKCYEVSAMNGQGLIDAISYLAGEIVANLPPEENNPTISLTNSKKQKQNANQEEKKQGGCC